MDIVVAAALFSDTLPALKRSHLLLNELAFLTVIIIMILLITLS